MCGHSEPEEVVKCLGAVVRRVVSCSKWVLKTNLRSLEKTLKTLNISLVTEKVFNKIQHHVIIKVLERTEI